MGLMNSKDEWAEVYNNGSPGSPDSADVPPAVQQPEKGKLKKKKFLRSIDPRSISDDVERTPIQAGAAAQRSPQDDQCATPVLRNQTDKFKAAMDPRSPSGLPRTPILVQEDDAVPVKEDPETPVAAAAAGPAENVPKRGAMIAKKLEMEEKEESGEIVVVEKEEEEDYKDEIVVDETETESAANENSLAADENSLAADLNSLPSATGGKSLPRVQDLKDLPSDCRSPLLIESSSPPTEAKTSSQKKSRIPLRIKQQHQDDNNAREDLATRMMKGATINDEQNSSVENSEGSLII